MTTAREEAQALTIVIDLVKKQHAEATAKKKHYFEATSAESTTPLGQGDDLAAFFGQGSELKKNQAELTKWTRIEREYQLVRDRLQRLLENAKRRAKKEPEPEPRIDFTHVAVISYMYDEAVPIYGTSEENAQEALLKYVLDTHPHDAMDPQKVKRRKTTKGKLKAFFGEEDGYNQHINASYSVEPIAGSAHVP